MKIKKGNWKVLRKKWNRQWKINLIEKENYGWLDLFDGLV